MMYWQKKLMEGIDGFYERPAHFLEHANLTKSHFVKGLPAAFVSLLYWNAKKNEPQTNHGETFRIIGQICKQSIDLSSNHIVRDFLESNLGVNSTLKIICPSDKLIGDFAHTKLPKGSESYIEDYKKQHDILIEVPNASANKGVLAQGVFLPSDSLNASIFTTNHRQLEQLSIRIDDELNEVGNAQKLYEELSSLVDLIILYNLSGNLEKEIAITYKLSVNHQSNLKKIRTFLKKKMLFPVATLFPPTMSDDWRLSSDSRSWELSKAFEVRGHWRWQPYGQENALRKLIWINPHMKGVK